MAEEEGNEERQERKRLKKARKEAKRLARQSGEAEAEAEARGGKRARAEAEEAEAEAEPTESAGEKKRDKKKQKRAEAGPVPSASSAEIDAFRAESNIEVFPVEDAALYPPLLNFAGLTAQLTQPSVLSVVSAYISLKSFKAPSPIQAQCWPPLLAGRDVIGIASTGSGKTLTFLVPALLRIASHLAHNKSSASSSGSGKGGTPCPKVLVLAPTRELAMQSQQVCEEVGGFKSVCIYGGMPKQYQRTELRSGAEIVVATPGRLMDLMEEGALSMKEVLYLVLDEADRMLDEGFEPAIRKIVSGCPACSVRQTVMFRSALARPLFSTDLAPPSLARSSERPLFLALRLTLPPSLPRPQRHVARGDSAARSLVS